jgi:nitrogen fixation-related uncharacterized protein
MSFTEGDWGILAMSVAMFFIFVGFLIWGILSGQFKNVEEPKYRMLQDDREDDTKDKEKDGNHRKGGGAE